MGWLGGMYLLLSAPRHYLVDGPRWVGVLMVLGYPIWLVFVFILGFLIYPILRSWKWLTEK